MMPRADGKLAHLPRPAGIPSAGPPYRILRLFATAILVFAFLAAPSRGSALADSSRQRNVVVAYLNGAEAQFEDDDQRAVIKQAFNDMLSEPVDKLRSKRYPDYQLRPNKWSIIKLLQRYFVPKSLLDGYPDDAEFFRDVKKPEAQRAIRVLLGWLRSGGPQPKYRPQGM